MVTPACQVIIFLNSGNHIRHRICNAVGRMDEFLGTFQNTLCSVNFGSATYIGGGGQ